MILALVAIAWWAFGFFTFLYLERDGITWGDVLVCAFMGLCGPGMLLVIAGVALCNAEFWSKPVFKQNANRERSIRS